MKQQPPYRSQYVCEHVCTLVCLCVPVCFVFFSASISVSFLMGDHEPQRVLPRKYQGLIATSQGVSDNVCTCVFVLLCVCVSADNHTVGKCLQESVFSPHMQASTHFLVFHYSLYLCLCVCAFVCV